MNAKQMLIAARDLISDPKRWTTQYWARDAHGQPIEPTSPRATCFCSVGALRKVTQNDLKDPEYVKALKALHATTIANGMITSTNDLRGHFVVMKMFNEAIENA
jgi:hypothetical protein